MSYTPPYGHARDDQAFLFCICGREFATYVGLTRHVNGAYRKWAREELVREGLDPQRAREAMRATATRRAVAK